MSINLKQLVHLEAIADMRMRIANWQYELNELLKADEKIATLRERIGYGKDVIENHFHQVGDPRVREHFEEDPSPGGALAKVATGAPTCAERKASEEEAARLAKAEQTPETD